MLKTYTMLTKPGIILGNVVTTSAGFALASRGEFDLGLLWGTLLGLALVVASAGVFNNYLDREIDAKMERTKERALAKGLIPLAYAIRYGACLGALGLAILFFYTNFLTVVVALSGFAIYLVLYAFLKYRSFYGTIVGSLAGAVPPVVGYTAVSNRLDAASLMLFLVLVLWQMPHFFAIAVYRFQDYTAASIPVLPVAKGIATTKKQIIAYICAFFLAAMMLTFFGYTGFTYAMAAILLSGVWLSLSLFGLYVQEGNEPLWGKQMFVYSLVVIISLCLIIPLDTL